MTRILAVADEVDEGLYGDKLRALAPDLVLGCGDLPAEYLENLVSRLDVPLLYVPGNHDPARREGDAEWSALTYDAADTGPAGCVDIDGRIYEAAGLRVAGLGGSPRYRPGPNQYSERQMARRAWRLRAAVWFRSLRGGGAVDVVVTHAAPAGDDDDQDHVHAGFVALARLDRALAPKLHVHGHVRRYGIQRPDRMIGLTKVVNAIPYRLLEL